MNDFYDPKKLKIGQHVGVELDPYVLNYPMDGDKTTWVVDQGGRPFVLRFFQSNKGKVEDFLQNARKYASVKHPAITPNYPPFYSNLWVFSCSAVCGGENLYSFLGKYPDGAPLNVVISLFDNIAKALDQVHRNGLLHGHLDLSAIHVVNGLGLMTGFGAHNWMSRIDDSVMDARLLPPEYLKKEQKRTTSSDRFAFMKLLMAALLGESILDKDFSTSLPDSHPNLSDATWNRLLKWSRESERYRPKSLTEVIRMLRANLYKPEVSDRSTTKRAIKRYVRNTPRKTVAIGAVLITGLVAAAILWPESKTEQNLVTPLPAIPEAKPPTSFEALPQTLEEPLLSGGTAPKIEKIPPATFMMGDQNRMGDDNEKPVHEVDIPKGFYISKYEVTFDQYDKFAKATGRELPPDNDWGRGQRPVINVSWYDAKAYAVWLSDQTQEEYRLPTEIEWEYSARADSNTAFWYGNTVKPGYSVCDSCGSQWDGVSTAPVGSQASNPLGLFDMHGNVAEWVEDCYHDSYEGAPSKNQVWLANQCDNRVLRGGSWFDIPRVGRSATRYRAEPNLQASNWGFRVVRIIQQADDLAKSE
ncbi:SUMF1/EgtB/PvdO family nonheme iron enzyme [Marinomonas sp. M1K-6]|uniref:SUMF1/EgtB/PvdO family nonheme iron enzyme n=1 Tax=Marinomonas profundi TaxID=2726122 RepID=A0A847QWA4_9GAMM|nr:formylglycine-generating enzyme family protein [Marinomonas profundi]NLQ16329.1 SUMF1/EgtB/PvdO family nonheme iron enzyme [Marinomonas profundi]UDV03095.1 SUMF1/EgtB/PvdO family nonheme iron enzyme [Marinomonas profundi]